MTRDRSSAAQGRAGEASRAEIDALCAFITAAATLADQARSEAAGTLLRRARALAAERTFDAVDREGAHVPMGSLKPS